MIVIELVKFTPNPLFIRRIRNCGQQDNSVQTWQTRVSIKHENITINIDVYPSSSLIFSGEVENKVHAFLHGIVLLSYSLSIHFILKVKSDTRRIVK